MPDLEPLLVRAARHAAAYRQGLDDAPVFPSVDLEDVRAAIGGPLPEHPQQAETVIDELVSGLEPAMVATTGPRYFGFVIGGALPAPTAAEVIGVGWDQPAYNYLSSPAAAVVEEVAGAWLVELLGLPADASFGFVTGGQAANTVCLAAARHHVLAEAGWDVERDGLAGGPGVRILAGEERHATIDRSLRLLGFGAGGLELVPTDPNGAIDIRSLEQALSDQPGGPTIVCLQAGNVNTGACDDLASAVAAAHLCGAWAHVDGAFGLWAAASPAKRHLVRGIETADSWATDGHKWLNVPYDCGYAFCAHPNAHAAAMAYTAAYLVGGASPPKLRSPGDYVPESSRRARGLATWAAIRELGREGVSDLVDRCCGLASRFATELDDVDGITIGNDVVLNQVLVRFTDDASTDHVIDRVQRTGECWMGGTTWKGRRYMRISVSSWRTTEEDVDRSVRAIVAALAAL